MLNFKDDFYTENSVKYIIILTVIAGLLLIFLYLCWYYKAACTRTIVKRVIVLVPKRNHEDCEQAWDNEAFSPMNPPPYSSSQSEQDYPTTAPPPYSTVTESIHSQHYPPSVNSHQS